MKHSHQLIDHVANVVMLYSFHLNFQLRGNLKWNWNISNALPRWKYYVLNNFYVNLCFFDKILKKILLPKKINNDSQ